MRISGRNTDACAASHDDSVDHDDAAANEGADGYDDSSGVWTVWTAPREYCRQKQSAAAADQSLFVADQ